MTKLGWTILALIVLVVGGFVSLLTFGHIERARRPAERGTARQSGVLAMPVSGYPRGAIRDSWGDARAGGTRAHHGTDIMAAGGTPVVAAAAGTVEKLFVSHDGGNTIYVRSPDRRWSYYYAHLAGYAQGLHEGQTVRSGDPLGFVGDTGNAGAGNTHLHFGLQRMRAGERWWQGEAVNPYPLLAGTAPAR